jgi:hypothetical protein
LRSDLVELVDDDKVRVWHEPTDSGFSRYYECNVYPTGIADSDATATETTSNTPDGSNNQTEGSGDQTAKVVAVKPTVVTIKMMIP